MQVEVRDDVRATTATTDVTDYSQADSTDALPTSERTARTSGPRWWQSVSGPGRCPNAALVKAGWVDGGLPIERMDLSASTGDRRVGTQAER